MENDLSPAREIKMAYHNAAYLFVFLPLALLAYHLAPRKARRIVLLIFNCIFYWSFSKALIVCLLGTILFTHYIAIWLYCLRSQSAVEIAVTGKGGTSHVQSRKAQKAVLIFGITVLLFVLGYLKYYNFFAGSWNAVSGKSGVLSLQKKTLLLPLGISFFTLQAIGYMVDVYWGKTEVYLHPGKTALFLSFFPQIMEGPICSYPQTADALWKGDPLRIENLSEGSIRILWGLFKKMIIADRLNILVNKIFDHHENYNGALIAVAAIAYTIQLYSEFSGCIDIVIGSGRLFGIKMPENFRQPFFATDAADFWRRWHITLGIWLRTYVFYPVSVSSPVKNAGRLLKKRFGKRAAKTGTLAMSLFPVWLCNGLWHGPKWSYIFFGMYYFVVLLLSEVFDPLRCIILGKLHVQKEAMWYRMIRMVKTWVIIFVGELFFRARSLTVGLQMFSSMFRGFSFGQLTAGTWLTLGLDAADYLAISTGCFVVLIVGIIRENQLIGGSGLRAIPLPLRWCVYYGLIFSVVIFGAYGIGYKTVDLIYAGF